MTNAKPGDKLHRMMHEGVNKYDHVLLICSENSLVRPGVLNEIEGFISSYKTKYADLTVILTGGDAHFLLDSLKNDIFANSNFLLEGLNYILEHNKDSC